MATNHDEGYIKFNYDWIPAALPNVDLEELIYWRQKLYDASLIGSYPDGIGFGNISMRYKDTQFIISGSATGNQSSVDATHFALVEEFDLAKNWLGCIGNIPASSESLSHAAIYQALPEVNAIIHIHHKEVWNKYLNVLPTSSLTAAFGTPDMAFSLIDLAGKKNTNSGIIVMGGHKDGLIIYDTSLGQAGKSVLDLF